MIKNILLLLSAVCILTSCISSKVYKELEDKYADLKKENKSLLSDNETLSTTKESLENELNQLKEAYDNALDQKDELESNYTKTKSKYDNLKSSYKALEKNSSSSIAKNAKKNRELLAKLDAKESILAAESARLEKLKKELEERSDRVIELENIIASKDKAMSDLKNAISKALVDFEGKGLTVEQREGKVYVSMENKLLFSSGSWNIGSSGRKAINQLGSVLASNPDISVLIEGHTDNVPYKGNGELKNNWDLSTKRATTIINILSKNKDINPENLTAAGRGEFSPVRSNETSEGRAKNRRIEVILKPKLDKLSELLGHK